jgi:hypothetical protein
MGQLSLVRHFPAEFTSKIDDQERLGVVKIYRFKAKFKTYPQDEETLTALQKKREDEGMAGLLREVLVDVELLSPTGETFADGAGNDITAKEFVTLDMIVGQDATQAFWDKVNAGIIEKNSKKSRKR